MISQKLDFNLIFISKSETRFETFLRKFKTSRERRVYIFFDAGMHERSIAKQLERIMLKISMYSRNQIAIILDALFCNEEINGSVVYICVDAHFFDDSST